MQEVEKTDVQGNLDESVEQTTSVDQAESAPQNKELEQTDTQVKQEKDADDKAGADKLPESGASKLASAGLAQTEILFKKSMVAKRSIELNAYWGSRDSSFKAVLLTHSPTESLASWCAENAIEIVDTEYEATKTRLPTVALYEEESTATEWKAAIIVRSEEAAKKALSALIELVDLRRSEAPEPKAADVDGQQLESPESAKKQPVEEVKSLVGKLFSFGKSKSAELKDDA